MNWRESLRNAIRQGSYAKGAKAPSAADNPDLLHLLHTFSPDSKNEGVSNERPNGLATEHEVDRSKEPEPLEEVLKGRAVELWSNDAGCLFIVADEADVRLVGEPRGTVYTTDEMRCVIQIGDPKTVREIHEWKRKFDGRLREYQDRKDGA